MASSRCDLLSECIFDLLLSNSSSSITFQEIVVICFQNVSLIYCYPTVELYSNAAEVL